MNEGTQDVLNALNEVNKELDAVGFAAQMNGIIILILILLIGISLVEVFFLKRNQIAAISACILQLVAFYFTIDCLFIGGLVVYGMIGIIGFGMGFQILLLRYVFEKKWRIKHPHSQVELSEKPRGE